jgi:hypothetical protein
MRTFWSLSSCPASNSRSFGYSSCGSSWGYGWGISIGVCESKSTLFFYRLSSIVFLLFLIVGLVSCRSHRDELRDEEIANMAYVHNARLRVIPTPTTYAATYDPQRTPAKTHGPDYNQRARPTSYAAPYASTLDSENEPQYPATAYPFTGYSVVSLPTLLDDVADVS